MVHTVLMSLNFYFSTFGKFPFSAFLLILRVCNPYIESEASIYQHIKINVLWAIGKQFTMRTFQLQYRFLAKSKYKAFLLTLLFCCK